MSSPGSLPASQSIPTYIEDGARIAAILLVWAVIAAFFTYGVSEIGGTGSLFETIGPQLGGLFAFTGVLNAVIYLMYRAIDYWESKT